MEHILEGLNPQQRDAVTKTINQSALVLAGAGSGKTATTVRRIAYIIEGGTSPTSIMAITFTNKAAKELQERITSYVGEEQAKRITTGTFHKICIQMLKRYGERIGIPKTFTIADPDDQKKLMRKAMIACGEPDSKSEAGIYLGMVSDCKNKMMTTRMVYESATYGDGDFTVKFAKLYEAYQDLLTRHDMLDFDDLLMKAVQLLKQDETTREYYQKRYKYICVDEYQDSNPCQYQLIRLLSGKERPEIPQPNNVFAVGDDGQSIYGFRGSDLQIILDFEQDFPEAIVLRLEQNYRSTKKIVHAGNTLIKCNKNQKEKTLFTQNEDGDNIQMYRASNERDESEFIAQECSALIQLMGVEPKDIAILYRTNVLSRELEKQLMNQRLPYQIVGGTSFYERMEVKDTLSYMKVIVNPRDDIAMERIMSIFPGIGKTTIESVKKLAKEKNVALSEAFKQFQPARAATKNATDSLRQLLKELYMIYRVSTKEKRADPVTKIMEIVWARTAYKERLKAKNNEEAKNRLDNLNELEYVARMYEEQTENPTLVDFLDGILLQSNEDKESPNAINLMSVHASKGLEFPYVFVMGCEEGIFPHKRSLSDPKSLEEERRIAYVALTRAEKKLFLTYAKTRNGFDGVQWNSRSRFLDELPPDIITEIS